MRLFGKLVIAAVLGGAAVTIAGPAATDWLSPSGTDTRLVSPNMTLQEMVSQAASLHGQVLGDFSHVIHLQQIARKQKDVIKLNCVNDKLVQIKPQLNIVERAQSTLPIVTQQAERVTTFSQIIVAAEDVRHSREEADQCVGESPLETETANTYTHPPIEDPTGENPWGSVVEPPAYASPFN